MSVLRYFGAKARIAPWIVAHLPAHYVYVEPFAGSAAVLLAKPRARVEVLGDADDQVVCFFRALRRHPRELARAVRMTPYARAEQRDSFGAIDGDDVESARRYLVRSWMTMGGIRRTAAPSAWRRDRRYTSCQSAAAQWTTVPARILAAAERLRGVQIEHGDYADMIRYYDHPDATIYLDPPYLPETRKARYEYAHEMTVEDHERLLDQALGCRSHVVISGYDSPLYSEALHGWQRAQRCTRGGSNVGSAGRTKVETLWISPRSWIGRLL